jgi:DNA-binding MarR family transcriptional regulator
MLMGGIANLPYSQRRTLKALKHMPALTGRGLGYRQFQVLSFIHARLETAGVAPSYSEICDEFGIERSNLSQLISGLERRGLIARAGVGRVRRIKLT